MDGEKIQGKQIVDDKSVRGVAFKVKAMGPMERNVYRYVRHKPILFNAAALQTNSIESVSIVYRISIILLVNFAFIQFP